MKLFVGVATFLIALFLSYQIFPGSGPTDSSQLFPRMIFTIAATALVATLFKRSGVELKPEEQPEFSALNQDKPYVPADTRPSEDYSALPADWSEALSTRGLDPAAVERILRTAFTSSENDVLPAESTVFKAFHLTPLSAVKVVILGQDPYPKPKRAEGLAFSVPAGRKVPQSLLRIFSNLKADLDVSFSPRTGGGLSGWAGEGVLLLNSALTVEQDKPGSHLKIWESFIDEVLETLKSRQEPTVFMLWGSPANKRAQKIGIGTSCNGLLCEQTTCRLVFSSTHPVKETPSRYERFADTKQFSGANDYLQQHGFNSVDWNA